MSVTSWWTEIAQLSGSAVPPDAGEAHLSDELLGGAWWAACERAAVTNSPWLAEISPDHPAVRLLAAFEPGAEIRALAAAHAADAGRRQRHGLPGAEQALATAACLWAGEIPPDDAWPDGVPGDEASSANVAADSEQAAAAPEQQPQWGWAPARDLAARIQPDRARQPRTIRLAVTVPDGFGGVSAGNLCVTPTDDGQLLADPVAMMFAEVDPAVLTEIDHAWHWAVNRDRFRPGSGCRWAIVNSAGRPVRYVPDMTVGAVAAAALGYALRLMPGTRGEPRQDALVAAGMLRSGALAPTDDEVVVSPASRRLVVHPDQNRAGLPNGVKVRTATTASEAVRHLRRPRYVLMTMAVVVVVALVAGFITFRGAVTNADTERKATANLAARLAVDAGRQYSTAPDRALQLALASYRLAPDSAQTRTAVLQAMYRDVRLAGVLPAAAGTPRVLALSNHATAVGTADGSVSVYDENTHRVAYTDKDHTGAVTSLAYSPDARLLASSGDDGRIVLRDGRKPPVILPGKGILAFSPDSRLLASAADDGAVTVTDLATGTAHTLDHRATHLEGVVFVSPTVVAAGGDDKEAVLYDVTTGKPVATFTSASAITSVTSDGKGTGLLFTDFAGALHYADPQTGKETHTPEQLTIDVRAVLRPGHGIVARSPVEIAEFPDTPPIGSDRLTLSSPPYPGGGGTGVPAVSPDGTRMAFLAPSGAVLLWRDPHGDGSVARAHDLTSGFPISGTNLLLVSAGGFLVTYSELALVRRDGQVVASQTMGQLDGVYNPPLTYSDRFRLVTAMGKGTATILRVDGEKLENVATVKATTRDGAITAIAIDEPHSRILVARSGAVTAIPADGVDHPVERLIYRANNKISQILPFPSGHDLGLSTVDGVVVLAVSSDGFVTGNGQRLGNRTFTQAITPDDNTVTTAAPDGSVSSYTRADGVWTETRLQGHQGTVLGLTAFDNLVISAGRDAHVIVSDAHDGSTVVDVSLAPYMLPHTVWRDGDTARVSHSSPSAEEAVLTLAPAAAARAACAMSRSSATVGDLAPDAAPTTGGIALCPGS